MASNGAGPAPAADRDVYFLDAGWVRARVAHLGELQPDEQVEGPLVLESPWTTVVVDPGASARRTADGTLVIEP